MHTFNPGTLEAETDRSETGLPCLRREFKVSKGYIVRLFKETNRQNQKILQQGWRDGSVVQSTVDLAEDQVPLPSPTW